MAYHRAKRVRQDDSAARISVSEDYEVRHWAQKLGVAPQQLKEVVRRVGPKVKDVQKALGE